MRSRGRLLGWAAGGLLLVLLAAAAWLAHLGLSARSDLEAARADLETARTQLLGSDQATVDAAVRDAQRRADAAARHTHDPVWRAASVLPWVGPSLKAASGVADVVDQVTTDVLPGLVAVRTQLDPARLRAGGAAVDLAPLAAAEPELTRLLAQVTASEAAAGRLPTSGVPGVLATAATDLRTTLASTRSTLQSALLAARLLPPMLGADGPRSYLMVLQSNNEARGTGGIVGGYGVLVADRGSLRITRIGPNNDLHSLTTPALNLGPDYTALYGDDPALWPNVNLSPHYPYAAQLMLRMWRDQFGQQLDGVVAVDPVALSSLLAVTGPVRLADGSQVSASDVAALMMKDIYVRWPLPSQGAPRGQYQMEVGAAVVRELFSGKGSARGLLDALGKAAGERRLLVYSAHPAEEAQLAGTSLGGVVDDAPGPYAALVVNNGAGNKLDYYLGRSLSYTLGACSTSLQQSTITATLTNGAPASGLPEYASFRLDRGLTAGTGHPGDGSTVDIVQVYGAIGSQLTAATLDGRPVAMSPEVDHGRPVYVLRVELAAGQRRVLQLQLVEPRSAAAPRAWVQPLVVPPSVSVSGTPCG